MSSPGSVEIEAKCSRCGCRHCVSFNMELFSGTPSLKNQQCSYCNAPLVPVDAPEQSNLFE